MEVETAVMYIGEYGVAYKTEKEAKESFIEKKMIEDTKYFLVDCGAYFSQDEFEILSRHIVENKKQLIEILKTEEEKK
jgi:hypothetical protein